MATNDSGAQPSVTTPGAVLGHLRYCVGVALDVLRIDVDKVLISAIAVGWSTTIALALVSLYHLSRALS